jgi:hypothetical protein
MSHPVAAGLKGHGNPFCQCSAPFVLADDGTFSILSPERNVNKKKIDGTFSILSPERSVKRQCPSLISKYRGF